MWLSIVITRLAGPNPSSVEAHQVTPVRTKTTSRHVADDERPARSFVVSLLRSFDDVAVVGEAASGKDAVAIIEKERPDLALLDWQMPELDGIGIVRMLKKEAMVDEEAARASRTSDSVAGRQQQRADRVRTEAGHG